MNRFQRSWALFKCSIQVIGNNKKLLLFPIIISLLMGFITLFFIAPIALWQTGYSYTESAHWTAVAHRWVSWDAEGKALNVNPAGYALLAGLYLVSTFLATFFNVAFYSQIICALQGRPVSISGGLRVALSRLNAILAWSLFAGLIGLLIKALEERVGVVGRWIVRLIGLAWSVASIFVIPSIVMDPQGANPVSFLKTSASMLKKTWGESLVGFIGIRIGGLLALLVSLVLLGLSTYLSIRLQNFWILGGAIVVWFLGMMAFMYVLSVASHVYRGALFVYASGGVPPAPFQPDQMNMAWKVKSGS
jgi:hypothetical protein